MARIIYVKRGQRLGRKVGIHLKNPTKIELTMAKHSASVKGFPAIYVHGRKNLK